MLCLVADNTGEQAEQIGRIIGARLRAAMKARGWTQGQVHYQANRGQGEEIVSLATVSALIRGAIGSPSVANTLAVARALDLTLDQAVGISPMPETIPRPLEDDVATRMERLENTVRTLLETLAVREEESAEELEQGLGKPATARDGVTPSAHRRKKAK